MLLLSRDFLKCSPHLAGKQKGPRMDLVNQYGVDVTETSSCPAVEPKIGWNSSCEHAKPGWKAAEAEAKRPKCHAKLVPFKCDWSAYLEANPATKAWAKANPAMAEQERIKLTTDPLSK